MLTVAGGIILAIVLIAVFIGSLLFDVEWIPKEPNAGMPNDGVFWLPSADPSYCAFSAEVVPLAPPAIFQNRPVTPGCS